MSPSLSADDLFFSYLLRPSFLPRALITVAAANNGVTDCLLTSSEISSAHLNKSRQSLHAATTTSTTVVDVVCLTNLSTLGGHELCPADGSAAALIGRIN